MQNLMELTNSPKTAQYANMIFFSNVETGGKVILGYYMYINVHIMHITTHFFDIWTKKLKLKFNSKQINFLKREA